MSFTGPELRQALMQAGSLLPMNAEAVAALEHTDPLDELPLPPGLSCDRILERIHSPRPAVIVKFPPPARFTPAAEGLARAARNGEELPDEVIAQVEQDRTRIEGASE